MIWFAVRPYQNSCRNNDSTKPVAPLVLHQLSVFLLTVGFFPTHGFLYCIGYLLECMIFMPLKQSAVWKEGFWRISNHNHNTWSYGGLLAVTCSTDDGQKSCEWINQAELLTGVKILTWN